ncbi:alpha/beta fold hydrolase [Microbispora sp. H10885]|uniref:alpha/beta fold hydrolase n=1 Tax=Microbispora sp. H10885 TaxID=2729110 RepID=UPI0016040CEC|nr:alpha/beta hydrolase [Microbispora sp. H10885]
MSSITSPSLARGRHEISIEGTRQVFHVAGTGPVCLVHSGGPGIAWEYLRTPALEEHLTMVYLEPIGTGSSGRLDDRRDYRIDTYARFVHGVVEHLGVPAVFLLGHSHGGFVVQRYALDHPGHVAGAILYSTSPVTGEEFWADAMANISGYPQRLPHRPAAGEIPDALQRALAAQDDEAYTTSLREILPAYFADYWAHKQKLEPMRAALNAWIDPMRGEEPVPFDVRDELRSLEVPVLIISGAHDFFGGTRWARVAHESITGSRLTVLENSGHMGHLEQPQEFARAIVEFVRA